MAETSGPIVPERDDRFAAPVDIPPFAVPFDDGTIAARLAPVARYGVTYEPAADGGMGNVYYNGALVRTFVDYNEASGALFAFNSDDADPGDTNLRVEHDADGTVTGVRAFTGEVSF